MTADQSTAILARVAIGFRTDAASFNKLEQDVARALLGARSFGGRQPSSSDWKTNWHQEWSNVEGIVERIRALMKEMEGSIESINRDRRNRALKAWETIQSEDAELAKALSAVRAQVMSLNAPARQEWNFQARPLESHLERFKACALALRIKLELRKVHSREEVNQLVELYKSHSKKEVDLPVENMLSKLPHRPHSAGVDAATYEQELRKAAVELEREQHEYRGFMDVVKGLLTWVETTEERVRKNLSFRVDRT